MMTEKTAVISQVPTTTMPSTRATGVQEHRQGLMTIGSMNRGITVLEAGAGAGVEYDRSLGLTLHVLSLALNSEMTTRRTLTLTLYLRHALFPVQYPALNHMCMMNKSIAREYHRVRRHR